MNHHGANREVSRETKRKAGRVMGLAPNDLISTNPTASPAFDLSAGSSLNKICSQRVDVEPSIQEKDWQRQWESVGVTEINPKIPSEPKLQITQRTVSISKDGALWPR
ncbi:hypothetical protein [Pseudomonas syringae]|uniref:hypothetical protein n=1 Tax=Pseudomonas syringae TaxID=317 RepID=UPI003F74AF38